MKKLTMVLGVFAFIFSFNVMAQKPGHENGRDPEQRMEQHLSYMKTMLELTDEQYADIEGILKKSHAEMQAIKSAAEQEHEARREKAQAIKEGTDNSIKEVLTADQQLKFEAMQEMKEGRHANRKRKQGDRHGRK